MAEKEVIFKMEVTDVRVCTRAVEQETKAETENMNQ